MNKKYLQVKNLYDSNVHSYVEKSAILLHEQLSYFLRYVPQNGKILDMGCGPGHDTEYFAKKEFRAIGIDFSPKMIEFCIKKRKFGKFKKINMVNVEKEFPKNYFDGVWMSSSLTHLEDIDIIKILKQVINIIAKNRVVAIIVKKRLKRNIMPREVLDRQFYKREIIDLIKLSKLSVIKSATFKCLDREWLFIIARKR